MSKNLQLFAGLCLLGGSCALAGPLQILPASTTTPVGSTVTLDVNVDTVNDLYSYQFDVSYNPLVLSAVLGGVSEGPFLLGGGSTSFLSGFIDNTAGIVSFIANTLIGPVPGVNGSGVLASIQFDVIADGTSSVELQNVVLLNSALAPISLPIENAQVSTGIVPEPSAAWLAIGSIAFLFSLRRFRRM